MNFAKSAVAASLLMGLAGHAAAATDDLVNIYGKINVDVQNSDTGESKTEVKSNASRFGVKGSADLTDGLEAIYQMEWEVNVTDEDASKSSTDNIKARNQFVGLRGGFGTALVGRNDTMLKQSQGGVDQFNDLQGDLKTLFKGDNRLGDSFTYETPTFGGLFKMGVSYITEDNTSQREKSDGDYSDGVSVAAMLGDSHLKKTSYYASVAYDDDVAGYNTLRASAQAKFGAFILGGMYQKGENSGDTSLDYDGFLVSGAYVIDKITLKLQYQDSDLHDLGATNYKNATSAGIDYKLGNTTKVYAFYTKFAAIDGEDDGNYLALGIEQKF
ncbi:porin [Gallaecimonas mangrovi]|uniref:porin n=1 Tax=Gallaecimonas mangrovi TaxID=2291597 RepID=UPI000E1FB8C9|nr:porin [Gallaecimonas mangrovi]